MAEGEADDLLPCADRTPDHVLVDRERRAYLADAGLALPKRLRAVVIDYFFQERPMLEIAAAIAACSDFRARLDAAPRPLLERAAETGLAAPSLA